MHLYVNAGFRVQGLGFRFYGLGFWGRTGGGKQANITLIAVSILVAFIISTTIFSHSFMLD